MKKNVILSGLLLALVSCGPIDDMKEMKNTTTEMKDTTKGMASSTKRIDGYSANTYRDMRLDTSISNGFKALNEMEAANSLEQKVIAAAYYMASFEFQLWKNNDLDDEALRQKMYALSVKRLFADIKEYVVSEKDAHKPPPSEKDASADANKLKNLYAISVAMHEINPNQEVAEKVNGVKLVSMLDLVTDGLRAAALNSKMDLAKTPEYQKIVAQNEELAVMLLQLRYNILAGKALKLIADLDGLFNGLINKTAKSLFPWKPDLTRLTNTAKIEYAVKVTHLALDARKRLVSTGNKVAEFGLSSILEHMDISQVPKGPLAEVLGALKAK